MAERIDGAGSTLDGFLVQEMVDQGVEMLVGVAHDPVFGPVVACSAGGTTVELVHDVAVRVTPITDLDASEMVRSLRTFPLLEGFRGAPKADVPALEEVILRVSALVDEPPVDRGDGLQPGDGPAARRRGRRRARPRAGGLADQTARRPRDAGLAAGRPGLATRGTDRPPTERSGTPLVNEGPSTWATPRGTGRACGVSTHPPGT